VAGILAIAEAGALKPLARESDHSSPLPSRARLLRGVRREARGIPANVSGGRRRENSTARLTLFFEELLEGQSSFPRGRRCFPLARTAADGHRSLNCADTAPGVVILRLEATAEGGFSGLGMDADLYLEGSEFSQTIGDIRMPQLHAYVGVGMKHDQPYASIYLNRDVTAYERRGPKRPGFLGFAARRGGILERLAASSRFVAHVDDGLRRLALASCGWRQAL